MRNVRSVLKRKGFQVITVDAGTPVIEAVRRLRQHQIGAMPVVDYRARMIGIFSEAQMTYRRVRHLPVVEDGRLVGLISIGDIVKSRLEELEEETQMLRDLIVAGR